MARWKVVSLASVLIVALSYGGSIIKARYFPAAHSVDLTPLGPILLGIFALLALWVVAFASWFVETLRKPPDDERRPHDPTNG